MAEEHRELNTGTKEPIQIEVPGKTDTPNTGAGTTPKRGRPRKTGTETGTETTGTTEEKEPVRLAVLNGEGDTETPKPKKAKRKRTTKNNNPTFNAEQITALLMSMSIILGQSEGGKIFVLSEAEAKQIAEPLANIISKNDAFAALGEHSDSIALMTACFLIFVPKLIAYISYKKAKKVLKDNNVKIIKGSDKNGEKGKSSGDNRTANGTVTPISTNNGESLLSGLPSLM